MRKLNLCLSLGTSFLLQTIVCLPSAYSDNYAIVMGGAAKLDQNELLTAMTTSSDFLDSHGWKTQVLFDSDVNPAQWSQFPKKLQPEKLGQADHRFTLENFNHAVDSILNNKPGPNDQIEIALSEHGGVDGVPGSEHHVITFTDLRGKSEMSEAEALRFFSPTSELYPKLIALLQTGAKVHFTSTSCYGGANY